MPLSATGLAKEGLCVWYTSLKLLHVPDSRKRGKGRKRGEERRVDAE
jgi:hypothetical protein